MKDKIFIMKNTKNTILLITSIMALIIFSFGVTITIINQRISSSEQMETYLINLAEKEALKIDNQIEVIGYNSMILAEIISNDTVLDYEHYNTYAEEKILGNSSLFGMGYWFEPFYTNPDVEYYGPDVYKESDDETTITMIYSDK
jgi:hypothetical protein